MAEEDQFQPKAMQVHHPTTDLMNTKCVHLLLIKRISFLNKTTKATSYGVAFYFDIPQRDCLTAVLLPTNRNAFKR